MDKNLDLEAKIKVATKSVLDELGVSEPQNVMEACFLRELAEQNVRCIRMVLPFFYKGHRIEDVRFDSTYIVESKLMLQFADGLLDEDAALSRKMRVEADIAECALSKAVIVNFYAAEEDDLVSFVSLYEGAVLN